MVEVPEAIILASRKSDLGSVRQIRSYLRLPGPLDHALACTRAAMNRLSAEDLPDDLAGRALFLFEGLVNAISRKWLEDGKHKAIVRVPPMRGGSEGQRTLEGTLT